MLYRVNPKWRTRKFLRTRKKIGHVKKGHVKNRTKILNMQKVKSEKKKERKRTCKNRTKILNMQKFIQKGATCEL
jgi:hypothetical protein